MYKKGYSLLEQLNTKKGKAQEDLDFITQADVVRNGLVDALTKDKGLRDQLGQELVRLQGNYDEEVAKLDELLLAYKPIKEEYDLFLQIKAEQERLAKEQEEQKRIEEQRRIQAEKQAKAKATVEGKQLPQTGEAQTGLGLMGLGLVMLGALGFRKREGK